MPETTYQTMVIQESIKACLTASPDDHQRQLQPIIRIFHHGCPVHVLYHSRHPTTTGATCSNPLSITIISPPYSATTTATANVYVFSTPTFSLVAPFHSINHTVTTKSKSTKTQMVAARCNVYLDSNNCPRSDFSKAHYNQIQFFQSTWILK